MQKITIFKLEYTTDGDSVVSISRQGGNQKLSSIICRGLLGDGDEALAEVGQGAVQAIARDEAAEGGRVGEGEEVHPGGGGGGGGDGPQEQLRADGDAHPRLGHGQGGDGVLRL